MQSLYIMAEAAASAPAGQVRVEDPTGVLAILLTVLAIIFWMTAHPVFGRIFKVIPALVFCYFVPTALSTARIIPLESELYEWVKQFVLPACLLLLTLSLDVKGILRLGPKAGIMLLTGTAGVVIGGPIALFIWQGALPDDAWQVIAYLAGSWIGGGANALALQQNFGASDAAVVPIIIVDVVVANVWMGFLLFWAARHTRVDRWFGGDTSAITALEQKMHDFHERVSRQPAMTDYFMILALGFGFAWLAGGVADRIFALELSMRVGQHVLELNKVLGAFAWKVILVTTVGVLLSFTRARSLEGAGASKIGSVMIYLLVATIGAKADFSEMGDAGAYLGLGATWILIHIVILLGVGRLIRAPFFFIAVGSQANIGGAASAPVVAGAFNPVLAPVGVLLAVAGYVLGTYAGLVCIWCCKLVVGAD